MTEKPNPIPPLTDENVRNFWSHVDKTPGLGPDGECWEWTASKFRTGYGQVGIGRDGGQRNLRSNRVAFTICRGPIPGNLHVLHSCDNRACVNPDHLWLGTGVDNMRDCAAKGRCGNAQGEQHGRAKLTREQVIEIRNRYAAGGVSHQKLGKEYGVSGMAIGDIVRHKTWKCVDNPLP